VWWSPTRRAIAVDLFAAASISCQRRRADMARLSGLEHTLFWRGVLYRRHRRGPTQIADSVAR
jgi:hypothetical protein